MIKIVSCFFVAILFLLQACANTQPIKNEHAKKIERRSIPSNHINDAIEFLKTVCVSQAELIIKYDNTNEKAVLSSHPDSEKFVLSMAEINGVVNSLNSEDQAQNLNEIRNCYARHENKLLDLIIENGAYDQYSESKTKATAARSNNRTNSSATYGFSKLEPGVWIEQDAAEDESTDYNEKAIITITPDNRISTNWYGFVKYGLFTNKFYKILECPFVEKFGVLTINCQQFPNVELKLTIFPTGEKDIIRLVHGTNFVHLKRLR